MPFKTRRQKESAIGRRVNFIEGGLVSYRETAAALKNSKVKHHADTQENSLGAGERYDYVRAELIKIFVLAIIIIGLQLALKTLNPGIF